MYNIRQHYFQTSNYLTYESNYHIAKINENYKLLPSQTAQQTLKIVDRTFKSFFGLLKKRNLGNYNRKIKLPRYLNKDDYFVLIFTPAHFRIKKDKLLLTLSKEFKQKYNLKQLELNINSNLFENKEIKEIRIVPIFNGKWFEIQYIYKDLNEYKQIGKNDNFISIDLGVNNLLACIDNVNKKPILFDGKLIKSKNRYFNKELSKLKSITKTVNNKNTSNKIQKLKKTNSKNCVIYRIIQQIKIIQ